MGGDEWVWCPTCEQWVRSFYATFSIEHCANCYWPLNFRGINNSSLPRVVGSKPSKRPEGR